LRGFAKRSGEPGAADVMAIRAAVLLLALLALLAAGCATPIPSATPAPLNTASTNPLPTIDERTLVSGRLTCGEEDVFPAAAIQGPGGAELGGDAVAAGLRAVLAESGDPQLPRNGWHLVSQSDTQVRFVARARNESGWAVVALMDGPSGWSMDVAGECRLQFVLPPGIRIASWWLDPATGFPAADATTFVAVVLEACGLPTAGRVTSPVVVYAADTVTVMFGVVPGVGGGQDSICLDSPPSPYRVVLAEPLGNRRLLDGSVIPPRDATKPPG
jgi:hypothetical protein